MIVIYTSPGCSSCRKVKAWLKERELPYIEKNIFTTLLNPVEIKHLLQRSENGTEDIISKRSKIMQNAKVDIDSLSTNELIAFIQHNPTILKRPIILSEKVFQVGYDEEEIDAFVPHELRKIATDSCDEDCPSYPNCGELRKEE